MKNKEIKFETLKKSHKKYIIVGVVAVCIIGSILTFRLTHSKYRVTQSIDLGSGTINYKPYDFKIMAMYQQKDESTCTDDSCYNEITDRMPSSGYVINTSKSYCTLDNVNHDNEAKLYTYEGKHVFENLKKSDKCYLYFDVKRIKVDDIIASVNAKTTTPDFSKTATTDEGVYATTDGTNMYGGTTYYWRGAVTNNHVIFANKCWRIIRINGDKTIRLIYNGDKINGENKCFGNGSNTNSIAVTNQAYNSSRDQSNYVGWTYTGSSQRTTGGTASNAKTQTETWYNNSIGNNATYSAKVADGKFCNDRETASGNTWAINGSSTISYAAEGREFGDTPTFNCTNSQDIYTLKVGAITADEVEFAGGKTAANNTSYYLYSGQDYWTMSPRHWLSGNAYVFYVGSSGGLGYNYDYISVSASYGIRPVINLKSDTVFAKGGTGTANDLVKSSV